MTFNKARYTKNHQWELSRFANKNYYSVIGAFSKLLKYFVNTYNPISITTYADRRWSNSNNVYIKNNFKFVHATEPSYWYTKHNISKYHRFNYRKSLLKNKLEKYDETLTEWENMQLNGYDRIWDCGSFKYEMIL
jgi:hypothetical protein